MNLREAFSAAILILCVVCLAQTPAFAKDEWLKITSKNFQLYGDAGEKEMRAAAIELEQFREAFRRVFPRVKFDAAIPTNVIVFKTDESFKNYKPVAADGKRADWVAGYFQGGEDVNYIALSVEGEKNAAYQKIFHEYVHFLVGTDLGRSDIPAWFNEGIAEYYEQLTIENDRKATLGAVDEDNLRLLQENKLIPFETFFAIDNYSLHLHGSDGIGIFYAQAWALMHCLLQSNDGARAPQLSKFLNLVLSGKKAKPAFTEAFQTDYATMEKDLKKYVEQKTFRVQTVDFKDKLTFDVQMKIAPLSEAETKATLGDLLAHADRLDEAETHLKAALTLDPNSVAANAALGIVKAERRNFGEAKKYLEKAVSLDAKNYLTHYRYAYVLSREGMTEYGFVSNYSLEQATKMRVSLDEAIALNPNFPESYNLYAFISYVRNEAIDEAVEYLNKAIALAPGNQWYQLRHAELQMLLENFDKARRLARKVFETAPDEHLRVYARHTISQINSYQGQMESLRNYDRRLGLSPVTDQPLTDEEAARLNKLAMFEAINNSLRRPQADEKRVTGLVTKIECEKTVEFSIRADGNTLKLSAENFDALFLMNYSADDSVGEIGCGIGKSNFFAIITYRPKTDAKTRTAGEIVAIELVPKDFKLAN